MISKYMIHRLSFLKKCSINKVDGDFDLKQCFNSYHYDVTGSDDMLGYLSEFSVHNVS